VDVIGNCHSCVVDGQLCMSRTGLRESVRLYDNEWGFCQRVIDLARFMMK